MTPSRTVADSKQVPTQPFNTNVLAERLLASVRASTHPDGSINHEWLVLHIWLAKCDLFRATEIAISRIPAAGRARIRKFQSVFPDQLEKFDEVLVRVLPIMQHCVSIYDFRRWKEAGRWEPVVSNPDFLDYAHAAGLPINEQDIAYVLGPHGPSGTDESPNLVQNSPRLYFH